MKNVPQHGVWKASAVPEERDRDRDRSCMNLRTAHKSPLIRFPPDKNEGGMMDQAMQSNPPLSVAAD